MTYIKLLCQYGKSGTLRGNYKISSIEALPYTSGVSPVSVR